jgi:hypothetical protein
VDEVQSVLLKLDVSKGAGPDGISPLILKNRSLSTCVFPEIWKLSYVTQIFKKGNNVEDYRGVVILSALLKRFELLVYRTMYEDLKNLICVNQHGFMLYEEPIDGDKLVGVRFFCAKFN